MDSSIEEMHGSIAAAGERLHQVVVAPESPWAALAVVHGYGDHAGRYLHFMRWMGERGVAAMAVDLRGHGTSTGRHCVVRRWDDYLLDVSAMLTAARSAWPQTPLFVLGHSHGALIAAKAGIDARLSCAGCILSSPFFALRMPVPMSKQVLSCVASIVAPSMAVRSGVGGAMLSRDPEMIADTQNDPLCRGIATPGWFVQARRAQSAVRRTAAEFTMPLLMLAADDDGVADIAASRQFFDEAGSRDKLLRVYQGHCHELLRDLDRESIFEEICNWMRPRAAPPHPDVSA
jgi:alpha-beta hydrolase superfamily lysophospholipase